jgi:hypothetical protein
MRRLVALAALVMLAGCGGASKPSPTVSFLARADAICVKAKRTNALTPESSDGPSLASIAIVRARTAHELSSLKPPPALRTSYLRLVSAIARQASLLRRFANDFREGDDAGVLATHRKLHSNAVARPARLVGLTECV